MPTTGVDCPDATGEAFVLDVVVRLRSGSYQVPRACWVYPADPRCVR